MTYELIWGTPQPRGGVMRRTVIRLRVAVNYLTTPEKVKVRFEVGLGGAE
jgi:hypothetical protein